MADTVEVSHPGGGVEQGNEGMMVTVHSFLLPLVFVSFKMDCSWRRRIGQGLHS